MTIETLTLAGWFVGVFYSVRAGGPVAVVRALRSPSVPRRWKIALALCALPIPGPFDEWIAAAILTRITTQNRGAA